MKLGFTSTWALAALCSIASGSSADDNGATTYQASTYVYGDVVFDTALMLEEQIGRGYRHELSDCSNARVQCLNGDLVKLAVPKNCADFSSGRFYGEGIETRLIRTDEHPDILGTRPADAHNSPAWLLHTVGNDSLIFVYSSSGLIGFYLKEGTDLVSVARRAGLSGLHALSGKAGEFYKPLVTFSAWGACMGRLGANPPTYVGPERPY